MRRNKYRLARTLAAAVSPLSGRHANASRRVLMFHAVEDVGVDADHDLYNHSRAVFVAQIDALQQWAEGYRLPFVAFDGRDEAGLCLTFDDGYASIVSVVAPLLIERDIPFHVFVPVGLVSDRRGTHLSCAKVGFSWPLPAHQVDTLPAATRCRSLAPMFGRWILHVTPSRRRAGLGTGCCESRRRLRRHSVLQLRIHPGAGACFGRCTIVTASRGHRRRRREYR